MALGAECFMYLIMDPNNSYMINYGNKVVCSSSSDLKTKLKEREKDAVEKSKHLTGLSIVSAPNEFLLSQYHQTIDQNEKVLQSITEIASPLGLKLDQELFDLEQENFNLKSTVEDWERIIAKERKVAKLLEKEEEISTYTSDDDSSYDEETSYADELSPLLLDNYKKKHS